MQSMFAPSRWMPKFEELHTSADGVRVRLADGSAHACDYVFDARGFPSLSNQTGAAAKDLIQIDWDPHRASDPAAIVSATAVGSDPRRRTTPRVDLSDSTSQLDFLRVHLQSPHQLQFRGPSRLHGVPAGGRGFRLE